RIRCIGVDGQPKDYVMKLRRPQSEPPSFNAVLEEDGDRKYYAGYYTVAGSPTYLQNCAGLVMDRLFGVPNTYFSAPQFVSEFLSVFGEEVSGPYRADDIVVFGSAQHVAYVTGPGSTPSRAMIVSKDNHEPIR